MNDPVTDSAINLADRYFDMWLNREDFFWDFFIQSFPARYVASSCVYPIVVKIYGFKKYEELDAEEYSMLAEEVLKRYNGNDDYMIMRLIKLLLIVSQLGDAKIKQQSNNVNQ